MLWKKQNKLKKLSWLLTALLAVMLAGQIKELHKNNL